MKKSTFRRLWKCPLPEYSQYERDYVLAYPWNHEKKEDVSRYQKGADGYWYAEDASDSGIALISCTGDLMCEPRQHKAHRYGDTYFFHPGFQFVRGIFKASDLVIGNLETTLSEDTPYAGDYHRIINQGVKQYHCNAPKCYLDAVRYAGFDALVNANNHNLDSGVSGLVDTINAMDEYRFMHTGTFLPDDQERVLLINVNGIRLAVLSYATYLNKLEENLTPLGQEQLLNRYAAEKVVRDVAWARAHGAEYVVTYLHCGTAYKHEANEKQQAIMQEMADAGVDYIIGSHSHCLQYHDVLTAKDGRSVPLVYGMGNFITNEVKEICKHTGILQLLLKKTERGIEATPYFIPCYVFDEMGTGRFTTVPTDPQLNGGIYNQNLREAEAYIAKIVSNHAPLLPTCKLLLSDVCKNTGAVLPEGLENGAVVGCCLDLKEVQPHTLFFSLDGEEETIRKACKAGAVAVVAAQPADQIPTLVVPSVEDAYFQVCRNAIARFPVKTIVVTGHSGKTRTKELIRQVLRDQAPTLCSGDDPNGDTAVWRRLHPQHKYYIQEVSDCDPKRASLLLRTLRPDICILTDHSEQAREAIDAVVDGGLVLFNGDDAELTSIIDRLSVPEKERVRFAGFGLGFENTFVIKGLSTDVQAVSFGLTYEETTTTLFGKLPFRDLVYAMAAAFAVGVDAGMTPEKIEAALSKYACDGYQQDLLTVDGTLKLLLNCTCKTEQSAASALHALQNQPIQDDARRIAVLGDLDTGVNVSEDSYRRIAQAAAESDLDILCLIGTYADTIAQAAKSKGLDLEEILVLPDIKALESYLIENLNEKDALLLNGGRVMQFSTVIRKIFGFTDGQIFAVW